MTAYIHYYYVSVLGAQHSGQPHTLQSVSLISPVPTRHRNYYMIIDSTPYAVLCTPMTAL